MEVKKKRILKKQHNIDNVSSHFVGQPRESTLVDSVKSTILSPSIITKNENKITNNDSDYDSDDNKSVVDVEIKDFRKNEQIEEEEDEKTPFEAWKDKMFVKYSCKIYELETEDMEKEDINVQKFYVNFNIIKNTIQELYTSAKEYKELDFNGKTSTYSIQKNTYDLNIQKCKAYLELIKEETNGKLLTTREDKKAKKEYNLTMKELNGYKPFQENYKFEKIIKYRKYLIQLIDEKKKYLLKEFNIRYDPFFNRFYD